MFNMSVTDKVGTVQAFAGTTPPDGWLFCDGSAISRTTYADLFAAIGTTYGAGDGSTTFNLPNLSGVLGLSASVSVYGDGKGVQLVRKTSGGQCGGVTLSTWTDRDYSNGARIGSLGLGGYTTGGVGTVVGSVTDTAEGSVVGLIQATGLGDSGIVGAANLGTASQHAAAIIKY